MTEQLHFTGSALDTPIPYNRYPPLNPVKFYTHIYIHAYIYTHFEVVPLAIIAGYLL